MVKLTKRKGFNFFRSYYDVYNELESDKDKVAFIEALLDRQFLGIKPIDLKGMAKFAYISQTNSIDSQVKGYEDKTGIYLRSTQGLQYTPAVGGKNTPAKQVQVEGEVKEKEQVKKTPTAKFSFFNSLISIGANKELVNDWLVVRKGKKLSNTQTAFNGFVRELEKSGKTINQVLERCVTKSWGGFDSSWEFGQVVIADNGKVEEMVTYYTDQDYGRKTVTRTAYEKQKKAFEGGGWKFFEVETKVN